MFIFLGFIGTESGTAVAIVKAIKDMRISVESLKLNVSINTDTVGEVCGLLEKEFPLHHLVMVRCVSIPLVVSCATKDGLSKKN